MNLVLNVDADLALSLMVTHFSSILIAVGRI